MVLKMSEIISKSKTARILQVSSKETLIYDMPIATYELIADVMETWHWYHNRRGKCTVERVLAMMERFAPNVRDGVTMKREPTKPEIKGLPADSV